MSSDLHGSFVGGAGAQPGKAVSLSGPAFRFLDEDGPIEKTRRNLPHWRQAGCMYYVTFRLADSLPQSLLKQWQAERVLWLKLNPRPWSEAVMREYSRRFQGPVEKWLDAGHGSCTLRDPAKRAVVADALRFFDGKRYALDAFVVMPNHVHVLVVPKECDTGFLACGGDGASEQLSDLKGSFAGGGLSQAGKPVSHSLAGILQSWKGFSARRINQLLGETGTFWMDENFNHVVRSEAQWKHFREYIRENPMKANLREGEWTHWQCDTGFPACEDGDAQGQTSESL